MKLNELLEQADKIKENDCKVNDTTRKPIKVFISQPMRDKTLDEILATRTEILNEIKRQLDGYPLECLNTYIEEELQHPLCYIARSIELMAHADLIVFARHWELYDGCIIENYCARNYCQAKRIEYHGIMDLSDYKEKLMKDGVCNMNREITDEEREKALIVYQLNRKSVVNCVVFDFVKLLYDLGMMNDISLTHDMFREHYKHMTYMLNYYKEHKERLEFDEVSLKEIEQQVQDIDTAMACIRKFAIDNGLINE